MAPLPPAGLVQRPVEDEGRKSYLLAHEQQGMVAISMALRGAGGYGKTTRA